jgi:hypothetical protein
MNTKKLRKALLARFERVRIDRDDVVHVYGQMPNTNQTGWFVYGFLAQMLKTEALFKDFERVRGQRNI